MFTLFLQKHEDESEGWLHRQVRTLGHLQSLIKIRTIYRLPSLSPSFFFLQNEKPLFSKDGLKLFFTRAIPQGGRGKFFHISMSISQVGEALLLITEFYANIYHQLKIWVRVCFVLERVLPSSAPQISYFIFPPFFAQSPTQAQRHCSPSRLETGTSLKSWPTTRRASWCEQPHPLGAKQTSKRSSESHWESPKYSIHINIYKIWWFGNVCNQKNSPGVS